ncbi:hypothetical protein BHE74_00005275, partial [Ensete ventricosum]
HMAFGAFWLCLCSPDMKVGLLKWEVLKHLKGGLGKPMFPLGNLTPSQSTFCILHFCVSTYAGDSYY